jgi:hypothetical protein
LLSIQFKKYTKILKQSHKAGRLMQIGAHNGL